MPPDEKDKEKLVIDLLKKGHKTREIAKMAHVSNTTIKKIGAKLSDEVNEEKEKDDPKKKPLSVSSQAFKLFLNGKTVVQVAIRLDLPTDQALKINSDYLALQNRQNVISILSENGNKPSELLKLLHYLRENRIILKDVKEIVDIKRDIDKYKLERDQLELDNFNANETLKYYQSEINKKRSKYYN